MWSLHITVEDFFPLHWNKTYFLFTKACFSQINLIGPLIGCWIDGGTCVYVYRRIAMLVIYISPKRPWTSQVVNKMCEPLISIPAWCTFLLYLYIALLKCAAYPPFFYLSALGRMLWISLYVHIVKIKDIWFYSIISDLMHLETRCGHAGWPPGFGLWQNATPVLEWMLDCMLICIIMWQLARINVFKWIPLHRNQSTGCQSWIKLHVFNYIPVFSDIGIKKRHALEKVVHVIFNCPYGDWVFMTCLQQFWPQHYGT